ncbi:unnamed protein product [Trichobilharzia regenti]|nr:unnamed protein product [Trichobilharzia regenti]
MTSDVRPRQVLEYLIHPYSDKTKDTLAKLFANVLDLDWGQLYTVAKMSLPVSAQRWNDAEYAALNAPKLAEQLQPNTSLNDTLAVVSQIHKLARFQAARCGLVNCSQVCHLVYIYICMYDV